MAKPCIDYTIGLPQTHVQTHEHIAYTCTDTTDIAKTSKFGGSTTRTERWHKS